MRDQSVLLAEQKAMCPEEISQDGALSYTEETVSLLTSSSMSAQSFLFHPNGLRCKDGPEMDASSRKRESIPLEKKEEGYQDKRKKNNEAARRSREKRRNNDRVIGNQVLALLEDNARLKAELLALKLRFGLIKDPSEDPVQIFSHIQEFPTIRDTNPLTVQPLPISTQNYGFIMPAGSSIGNPDISVADEVVGTYSSGYQENSLKSLPHKLRFKMASGNEGADGFLHPVENKAPVCKSTEGLWSPQTHTMPSVCLTAYQNNSSSQSLIRLQLSALTKEVAELKKTLLSKALKSNRT
nr:E4 binding protein 4-3 [Danio rerio]